MTADHTLTGPEAAFGADPDIRRCPFDHFEGFRAAEGFTYVPDIEAHVVARYDDVIEVLRDPVTFSSVKPMGPVVIREERATLAALMERDPALAKLLARLSPRRTPVLLTCDPPEHRRQRSLLGPAFAPRRVGALEPMIRARAHALIDGFGTEVDLVSEYAVPLPITVIAHLLGVDDADQARFKRWSDDYLRMFGNHGLGAAEMTRVLRSQAEFFDYLEAEIECRRERPRDDMMTDALNARSEDHEPFSTDELLGIFGQFLVAGNETTTSLIASAALRLCDRPELVERLREDRAAVNAFVEEVLRLETPAQAFYRRVTRDAEVGGVPVSKGSYLLLIYASANRDERSFSDAAELDLERENGARHLAFGFGEHFCIGSGLGRLEARVALEVLLERVEALHLAAAGELEYEPTYIKRSLLSLPVRITSREERP